MLQDKAIPVGHIPSGLFIVCALNQTTQAIDGYLASWVQQAGFEPLMVSLAIKPGRPVYDSISDGEVFTINIVGSHNRNYVKHFWRGYDPNENPFAQIPHTITTKGGVILQEAKAVLECKLHSRVQPADHEIIFAQVLEGYVLEDVEKSFVHFRKTGASY